MKVPFSEGLPGQPIGILDGSDRDDGIIPQVRPDEDRLVVIIADDADAGPRVEVAEIGIKLGPELGILDVVDDAEEAVIADDGQPSPSCAQMGVIIGPIIKVGDTVIKGSDAKKSAHAVLVNNFFGKPRLFSIGECCAVKPPMKKVCEFFNAFLKPTNLTAAG
jgi:hypothetical protein